MCEPVLENASKTTGGNMTEALPPVANSDITVRAIAGAVVLGAESLCLGVTVTDKVMNDGLRKD